MRTTHRRDQKKITHIITTNHAREIGNPIATAPMMQIILERLKNISALPCGKPCGMFLSHS